MKTNQQTEISTIEELKAKCPKEFAIFCEKTGRLEEAVEFYASSNEPVEVLHAVDIAIQMNNYELAKTLLTITEELSEEMIRKAKARAKEAPERNAFSAGMEYCGVLGHYDYLKSEISIKKKNLDCLTERL